MAQTQVEYEYIEPHPGPQTQFLSTPADIAVYGGQAGGGKTWALLAEAGRWIDNPNYGAVIFRRKSTQVTNEGGLWDESMKLYPVLGGRPRMNTLDWQFDSGSNIGFRHLQHETDKLAWQGAQVPMIGFDELTHFLESQFFYLLSRNRSTCGVKPYIRATTNPVPEDDPVGGWVHRLLQWWIDPRTGFAIPERSGVMRWFIRMTGEMHWADSKAELFARFGESDEIRPLSVTFIPAKLSDNPAMMAADPMYKSKLLALPDVERQRLAEGNWNAKAQSGLFFKVGKLGTWHSTERPKSGWTWCRAWDLAATDGAGDWTVGALVGHAMGQILIADVVRGQWESHYRDEMIRKTAELDGKGVSIRLPQDPGAAGKVEASRLVAMLSGYKVRAEPVNGDKITRASGLASQCNAGNVWLIPGPWNVGLIQRLDSFPSKGIPDDEIDALSDAFAESSTTQDLGDWLASGAF